MLNTELGSSRALMICDRIMAVALSFVIYFIPISIAIVEFSFGVAMVAFFVKRCFLFSMRRATLGARAVMVFLPITNPLNWPLGAFILAAFLSFVFSEYKSLSFRGFMLKVWEWTFFYFIFVEAINSRKRLKVFLSVFAISAVITISNAYWQKIMGEDFVWNNPLGGGRVSASFRHPNDLGGYLVVALSLAFSFIYVYRRGIGSWLRYQFSQEGWLKVARVLSLILLVAGVVCLGLTYSRGAWLAFFVAILLIGFQRIKAFAVVVVLIVIFASFFSVGLLKYRKISIFSDCLESQMACSSVEEMAQSKAQHPGWEEYVTSFLKKYSGSGRSLYWRDAGRIIQRSPIFGSGINTYSQVAKDLKLEWGGYPHNCYLQLTAEMGLVGLAAFLWLVGRIFQYAMRTIKSVQDDFLLCVSWGAWGGLTGFLIQSALDTNFYSVQLGNLLWITIGLCIAPIMISKAEHVQR